MLRCSLLTFLLLACLLNPTTRVAQDAPLHSPDTIFMRECLILESVGANARSPVHTDALEAQIVAGKFTAPKAGDKVTAPNGTQRTWTAAKAGEDDWFAADNYVGAYACWTVDCEQAQTAVLTARGHSLLYVNGQVRYGDPYAYGYAQIPVSLAKGTNTLLFLISRGRLMASLLPDQSAGAYISDLDATLPDLIEGRTKGTHVGSVIVVNSLNVPIEANTGSMQADRSRVPGQNTWVPALSAKRVPAEFHVPDELAAGTHKITIYMTYEAGDDGGISTTEFLVNVVNSTAARKVTFTSAIDGSVQYYAVRPACPLEGAQGKPGIVLSLHGASVEAIGQSKAYSAKSWCHIVCPTNRRPYGFDWEDWGRLDAMEVLAHAQATLDNDPTKVWLTGHSMGGHGTWTVGSHFPDRFAAIAPSAGWESFWSYAGGGGHPPAFAVSELLTRASNPYRTLLRKYNYKSQGIYILHGDVDDNVPVTEARAMRDTLKEFHTDLGYFEQSGAGHWWDAGHDEGADCLDWAPIFDMFARRRLPAASEVQAVDFTTVCPEHSADCHWARIEMQERQLAPSRVQLQVYGNKGEFEGTTENVSRVSVQVAGIVPQRDKLKLRIDGTEIETNWPDGRLHLRKQGDKWAVADAPSPALKGPHRYGCFKNAFNQRFVYVCGTQGTAADTAAHFEKARYDLEQWGYRANGSFDVIADSDFDDAKYAGRNIILIGNANTNSAWDKVLKDCPLRVQQGKAVIGGREIKGDDLAMLFTYPRAGSTNNCVGVIGGTGVKGVKLTNRVGYFISGAAFPDVILYEPSTLQTGTGGVLAAGFLGEDWSVKTGEFVWRDDETKK